MEKASGKVQRAVDLLILVDRPEDKGPCLGGLRGRSLKPAPCTLAAFKTGYGQRWSLIISRAALVATLCLTSGQMREGRWPVPAVTSNRIHLGSMYHGLYFKDAGSAANKALTANVQTLA